MKTMLLGLIGVLTSGSLISCEEYPFDDLNENTGGANYVVDEATLSSDDFAQHIDARYDEASDTVSCHYTLQISAPNLNHVYMFE
jgi:hypothetical protein